MTAYVDTNVLIRHITGDDAALSAQAAGILHGERKLILTATVFLETAHVLKSTYRFPRAAIIEALTGVLDLPAIVGDLDVLTTALEHHIRHRIGLPDAVLAARALRDGPPVIASFDRELDRVPGVTRVTA